MNIKKNKTKLLENGLFIIATPIGNLTDFSKRAVLVLKEVDFIICENPKHSMKLLNKLGIKKKLIPLHDYNEEVVINKISKYQYNSRIGLVSDAGSPLISDPGFKLVKDFIKKDIMITSIPGPSSLITALQISGLPINKFSFYGFAPKHKKERNDILKKTSTNELTSVFFVSGKNLNSLLKDIVELFDKREVSICKELTKLNETVFRGTAIDVYERIRKNNLNLKGEFVVVISALPKKIKRLVDDNIEIQISNLLKKYSLTETVRIVHNLTEISKKELYKMAIELHND